MENPLKIGGALTCLCGGGDAHKVEQLLQQPLHQLGANWGHSLGVQGEGVFGGHPSTGQLHILLVK